LSAHVRGLIICTPTRDTLTDETKLAISENLDGFEHVHLIEVGLPVVEARNRLWERALRASVDHPGWLVLHVDDDAYWERGTVAAFVDVLQRAIGPDILAGYASSRKPTNGQRSSGKDGLVEVTRCRGHFLLHKISLLSRLGPMPWDPWDLAALTDKDDPAGTFEDHAFCLRVQHAGATIALHADKLIWHVDRRNGFAYAPGEPPCFVRDNRLVPTGRRADELYDVRTYGLRNDADVDEAIRLYTDAARISKQIDLILEETRRVDEATELLREQTRQRTAVTLANAMCRLIFGANKAL
jgi:hypothetical protein